MTIILLLSVHPQNFVLVTFILFPLQLGFIYCSSLKFLVLALKSWPFKNCCFTFIVIIVCCKLNFFFKAYFLDSV